MHPINAPNEAERRTTPTLTINDSIGVVRVPIFVPFWLPILSGFFRIESPKNRATKILVFNSLNSNLFTFSIGTME